MRRAPFIAAILVLLAGLPCHSIGTRTHAEIGMRCIEEYLLDADAMLPGLGTLFKSMENRRILYRACEFPDWGYGGINPDAGEASHWHPFNRVWAGLLAERHYGMPPDEAGQKELAFFFGAVCHDIADIPWHFSHGNDKSFLQMAGEKDHASHGDTEIGVDFDRYTRHTLRHISYLSNYVPFETLMTVMQRANVGATREQLQNGITREHLIMWFGPVAAALSVRERRAALPWCMAHVEDYYYGGIRHNAAACAMWVRYWYADILGGHCLQQMPPYFDNVAPDAGYVPYLGVSDTTLLERLPGNNTGQEPLLEIGGPAGERCTALVRFDLNGVAQDKPIRKATLWLASAGSAGNASDGPLTILVAPAPGTWQEGKGVSDPYNGVDGCAAAPGEAKWGDFPVVQTPNAISTHLQSLSPSQWMSMDVTPVVRSWFKDPGDNFGFILGSTGESGAVARFYSSQAFQADETGYCGGTRVAFRPMLILLP